MRKPLIWWGLGCLALLALLILGSIWLARCLHPFAEFLTWARQAPDPARFEYEQRLVYSCGTARPDGWLLAQAGETTWIGYGDDLGYHCCRTSQPLAQVQPSDWQDLPLLPIKTDYLGRRLVVTADTALLLNRDGELKQTALWYLQLNEPAPWRSITLPPEWTYCHDLNSEPAGRYAYFICSEEQPPAAYLVAVPLDDISALDHWLRCEISGGKAVLADLEVFGTSAVVVNSTKSGLYFGGFPLSADGRPGAWTGYCIEPTLPRGRVDLALVGGKPAISLFDHDTRTLRYLRALTAQPQSAAEWELTVAYHGNSFGWSEYLGDWQGRPVMVVADFGSMLLVAKTDTPREPQDWEIGRYCDIWLGEILSLPTAAAPTFLSASYTDVNLVTYQPQAVSLLHGRGIVSRIDGLAEALPMQ